jgi:hypothetical protein
MIFYSMMNQMSDALCAILLKASIFHSIEPSAALQKMMDVVDAYTDGIERVLGTPKGTIHLIDRSILALWLPEDSKK